MSCEFVWRQKVQRRMCYNSKYMHYSGLSWPWLLILSKECYLYVYFVLRASEQYFTGNVNTIGEESVKRCWKLICGQERGTFGLEQLGGVAVRPVHWEHTHGLLSSRNRCCFFAPRIVVGLQPQNMQVVLSVFLCDLGMKYVVHVVKQILGSFKMSPFWQTN